MLVWLCPIMAVSGQLYKVVDADGNIVYTDQPLPNAEAVNVTNTNTMPAMQSTVMAKSPAATAANFKVNIVSPSHQQTVRNNSGDVNIQVSIDKGSSKVSFNGLLQLFLDGKLHHQQTNLLFSLKGIDRGEHKIIVKLVNNSGKVIASSPESIFYLHRASVLTRAN